MAFGNTSGQVTVPKDTMSYTNADGDLYWNRAKPVYLRIADTPNGSGQLLKSKKSEAFTNPLFLDTEGLNYIRTRYAVDPKTHETIHPQQEVLWEIYADSEPPQSQLDLEGAKAHQTEGVTYYGKGLMAKLTAKDGGSGVKQLYTALNGGVFTTYAEPLPFAQSGSFTLTYYGVDQVSNAEEPKEVSFRVDVDDPKTYYNINGVSNDNVIGASTKVYLTREDAGSGIAETFYRFDGGAYANYSGKEIPFTLLEDGNHTLDYYSVDHVGNQEPMQTFEFYFDKSAPIMAADILGDRFIADDDKVYFSGKTKLKLTAVDNKSGVKEVLYSIDGEDFKTYQDPFYLPSISGEHIVRYYSLDNMQNATQGDGTGKFEQFKHTVSKIYIDLTGPTLEHSYKGPSFQARDTLFIGPNTEIVLKGSDKESGLQALRYSVDDQMDETPYTQSFRIPTNGWHHVELFGYDNVNNRNITDFRLMVDGTPPQVLFNYSTEPLSEKDGQKVYPEFMVLYLAATDRETGVEKLGYKLDKTTYKSYADPIKGFTKGQHTLEVLAEDKLGNTHSETVSFWVE